MKNLLLSMALCAAAVSAAAAFELASKDVHAGAQLPAAQVYSGFGCTGGNQSPELAWTNAPKGTKSFAITAYDPDAPTGSGWWHWVVYDIPADVSQLQAGIGKQAALPAGVKQGRNDFGVTDFGGACPPKGDKPHRYIFTVHALKVEKLDVPADASAAMVGFMLNANKLGEAMLVATYSR